MLSHHYNIQKKIVLYPKHFQYLDIKLKYMRPLGSEGHLRS